MNKFELREIYDVIWHTFNNIDILYKIHEQV